MSDLLIGGRVDQVQLTLRARKIDSDEDGEFSAEELNGVISGWVPNNHKSLPNEIFGLVFKLTDKQKK